LWRFKTSILFLKQGRGVDIKALASADGGGRGGGASGEEIELYPVHVDHLFIAQIFRTSSNVTTFKLFLDIVVSSLADKVTACVA